VLRRLNITGSRGSGTTASSCLGSRTGLGVPSPMGVRRWRGASSLCTKVPICGVVERFPHLRSERGFTLVEVLVAMFILLVGALGVITVVEGANAETNAVDTRIGATNLAREITEDAHAAAYDSLVTGSVVAALRQNASIAGTLSGSTWTVTRKGETYTLNVTACKYDSPRDGGAATHDSTFCANSAAPTTPADTNGDDFRRVDVTINWRSQGGRPHTLNQSALIVNPSGGLGPRIVSMSPLTALVQSGGSSKCQGLAVDGCAASSTDPVFTVTTATPADSVHWTASDGSSGDVTPTSPATSFQFTWTLGSAVDGTYTVNAQAFDDRGVPGDLKTSTVVINRTLPAPPASLAGGWDTRLASSSGNIVDLRWPASPDHDVIGYRVNRIDNGAPVQVCPPAGGSQTEITTTYCYDPNPPNASTPTYQVVAVDLTDAMDSSSAKRTSTMPAQLVVSSPSARPSWPTPPNLTSQVEDGLPTLGWDPATPRTGGSILFYRIYRDPASSPPNLAFTDRYDFTTSNSPVYTDPTPGSTTCHTYYVTAVDDMYNESDPIGPFPGLPC
jgi:prepilin-type N-terminal cleavage/methylation domain-containing protein